MPFSIDDLDQLFAITDLLANTQELCQVFQPDVDRILVKQSFFTGHFKAKYNELFDDLITSLIKKQLINHFPKLNPEQIILICEPELLKVLAPDLYQINNYLPKEGNNE